VLNAREEAIHIWSELSSYWGLQESRKHMNGIWQSIVKAVDELALKEDRVIKYSIDDMPATKTLLWETIPVQVGYSYDEYIVSIPTLQDKLVKPSNIYREGVDYTISNNTTIVWSSTPTETELFAPAVILENDLMEKYFNNGYLDIDMTGFNPYEKKHILRLIWHALRTGYSVSNTEAVVNALAGLPFMRYQGIPYIFDSNISAEYLTMLSAYSHSDGATCLYTTMAGHTVNITDKGFDNTLVEAVPGDIIIIGDIMTAVVDIIDDNAYIMDSVPDGEYDITLLKTCKLADIIYHNTGIMHYETNKIYYYKNGRFADLPEGYHENMLFGHRECIYSHINGATCNNGMLISEILYNSERATEEQLLDSEGEPIYDNDGSPIMVRVAIPGELVPANTLYMEQLYDSENEPMYGKDGEPIMVRRSISETLVPAFTPIMKFLRLITWKDMLETTYLGDKINKVYNEEHGDVYHVSDITGNDITLYQHDNIGNINKNDHVTVSCTNNIIIDIESIKQIDESHYELEVITDRQFRYGQVISVIQDIAVGDKDIHRGSSGTVESGEYVRDRYYLTVNGDMQDIYDNYEANGASLCIAAIEHRVLKIINKSGNTITVQNTQAIALDMLPVVRKTSFGNYGGDMAKPIVSISNNVVRIAGDIAGLQNTYIVLKESNIPATIYKAISTEYVSGNTVITVDREIEYTYTSAGKCILIKTMPYHNGICLAAVAGITPENIEIIVDGILEKHPDYVNNINKILTLLLPAGYRVEWQVGIG
jgi:hypothetical protein